MKILFTTHSGGIAGSTHSIAFLTKGLAAKGHEVYLAGVKDTILHQLVKDSQVHFVPMPFKSKVDRATIRMIGELVREKQIEIINAQNSKDRYLTIFAKWFYNLPVKLIHTRRQRPESIGGWIQNTFYVKNTDKIVVISDELKNIFISKGIPAAHLHVIYNGTPLDQYAEVKQERVAQLREKYGIEPGDMVIGCVARMKRQEELIKALAHIDDKIKVIFAGIAPGSLDAYIRQYEVKNPVIYAGMVSHLDALHLYKLMDVNVLPSTMDGFGLVLVEAMALGTPVVATRAGGIIDVVEDGVSGLLYESENPNDLAAKINAVLYQEELREKLIQNGKNTALQKFSIEKTIDQYEAFFLHLLSQ
ncbi:MAG: glycosyltransferase family 4 protein [Cyclobacteriaceae bacterium]